MQTRVLVDLNSAKGKNLKKAVQDVHREKVCLFIASSNNEQEKFAAALWLEKFDDQIAKKKVVPRPQSERKRTDIGFRYEPSSFAAKKRKLQSISLVPPPVEAVNLDDDDEDFEDDEDNEVVVPKSSEPSTEFSKTKLTQEMTEIWRQRFYTSFNKLYDFDPKEGEQNR